MFTNMCCRSGGSNLNAGTRTGNTTEPGTAADFTYASGTWVASTGVFTVASGNPSSDGVAVGDFASVYADGSSVTGFVGRVTARTTTTITVSLTAKMGTAPTDGTSNRTVRIGGAWAGPNGSSGFPLSLLETALQNSSNDRTRVNLKNNTTYSVTAAISMASSGGVVIQGYSSAYGDGGRATLSGGTSGASYILLTIGSSLTVRDMIFQNNGSTGSANGVATGSSLVVAFENVLFTGMKGAGVLIGSSTEAAFEGCESAGNATGIQTSGTSSLSIWRTSIHHNTSVGITFVGGAGTVLAVSQSVIADNTSHGINITSNSGLLSVSGTVFRANADGIRISGSSTTAAVSGDVSRNVFASNTGWGINRNSTARFTGSVRLNAFRSNTSGETTGLESETVSGSITLTADPFVDGANGNFGLNTTAGGGAALRGAGGFTLPGATNYSGSSTDYRDVGAIQHQDSGGGGSAAWTAY
jgi:hypothetical protein